VVIVHFVLLRRWDYAIDPATKADGIGTCALMVGRPRFRLAQYAPPGYSILFSAVSTQLAQEPHGVPIGEPVWAAGAAIDQTLVRLENGPYVLLDWLSLFVEAESLSVRVIEDDVG